MGIIRYAKKLEQGDTIGITAVSLSANLDKIDKAINKLKSFGFNVLETKNVRNNSSNFVSSNDEQRAKEFLELFFDENVRHIIAARGGEFAIDVIPYLHNNKEELKKAKDIKYIQGYSDISLINFYLTTNYNIATLNSGNISEFAMEKYYISLQDNIKLLKGEIDNNKFIQISFDKYQKEELEAGVTSYNLTEDVEYKILDEYNNAFFDGRIIGGCIDVITQVLGTRYDNTANFCNQFKEGTIWYIDNFGLDSLELYRRLLQMKNAGWFCNVKGFLFGRTINDISNPNFSYEYALKKALGDLGVRIVYDVDIGHVPPQFTIINGSSAKFEYSNGKGKLIQILD